MRARGQKGRQKPEIMRFRRQSTAIRARKLTNKRESRVILIMRDFLFDTLSKVYKFGGGVGANRRERVSFGRVCGAGGQIGGAEGCPGWAEGGQIGGADGAGRGGGDRARGCGMQPSTTGGASKTGPRQSRTPLRVFSHSSFLQPKRPSSSLTWARHAAERTGGGSDHGDCRGTEKNGGGGL